jgi:lipopolysaccharide export system permease protein
MIPFTTAITIPMGVLFGILMAYGRFSSNSEITAMRANGISIYKIFLPAATFGVIMTIVMFLMVNYYVPESNFRYISLRKSVAYSNPGIMLENRVFSRIPNTKKRISTLNVSEDGQLMDSVFIYEMDDKNQKIKITYADKGEWFDNSLNSPLIKLRLTNGRILDLDYDNFKEIQFLKYDTIDMNIITQIKEVNHKRKSLRELSWKEVADKIKQRIKNKQQVSSIYYVEFHKKFSIPIACLVFVVIGVPLAVSFHRSGKGVSFVSAIIIIFVYYIFLNIGEMLGTKNFIPPQLSMWLPNIIILTIGLILFYRKTQE